MGLTRNWLITRLLNEQKAGHRAIDWTWPGLGDKNKARGAIDEAFIQRKKDVLEGRITFLDYIWTFWKNEARDIYWASRRKALTKQIQYNTPFTLRDRSVVSSHYRGVTVGDNDTQHLVDKFFKEYDLAKAEIRADQLRVGLKLW